MTLPYEVNPMPHVLDVKCPACNKKARFEFAEIAKIHKKKDIPFFEKSDQFDYIPCKNSSGQRWHAALFFPGLHGRTADSILGLPEGYQPSDWQHPKYMQRSAGPNTGSLTCSACHHRTKAMLEWPADAYYQIDYKGHMLWAFHEESARELLRFVESSSRDFRKFKWRAFLMKIPAVFLSRKARSEVSKKLRRLIPRDAKLKARTMDKHVHVP